MVLEAESPKSRCGPDHTPSEALGENPSLTGFWCWQHSSAPALCPLFIWPFPPGVCIHLCVPFNQTFVVGFRAYPDNSECSHLKTLGLMTSAKNPLPRKFSWAGSGGHHSPRGTHSPHSFNGQEVGPRRKVETQPGPASVLSSHDQPIFLYIYFTLQFSLQKLISDHHFPPTSMKIPSLCYVFFCFQVKQS